MILRLASIFLVLIFSAWSSVNAQNLEKAETLRIINPIGTLPDAVELDESQKLLYVGFGRNILIYEMETGVEINSFLDVCPQNTEIGRVSISNKFLYVSCHGSNDHYFLFDKNSGRQIEELPECSLTRTGGVRICLYGLYGVGYISAINKNAQSYTSSPDYHLLYLSQDEKYILAVNNSSEIVVWNSENFNIERRIKIQSDDGTYHEAISMSKNNKVIAYFKNKKLYIKKLNNLSETSEFQVGLNNPILRFGEDNDTLIVSSFQDNKSQIFRISENKKIADIDGAIVGITADGLYGVAYRENGFHVLGQSNKSLGDRNKNFWLQNKMSILLNINVPNAIIAIDKQVQNLVNNELTLFPDTYTFSVSAPGYRTINQIVQIQTNQSNTLNFNLQKILSSAFLESQPSGATLLLDGKQIGKTPLQIDNLELRDYQYTFRYDDYKELTGTLKIDSEQEKRLSVTLQEIPGLVFSTTPIGAQVSIDGKVVGITPLIVKNLQSGRVQFEISLAGYATFIGRTVVPEIGKGQIALNLNPTKVVQIRGVLESSLLGFDKTVLPEANKSLVKVNFVPMLPIDVLARLTGLAVLGDNTRPVLAFGTSELSLKVSEPQQKSPTAFVIDNKLYAPLIGLESLGLKLVSAQKLIFDLEGDRIELEPVSRPIFTEVVIRPIRDPWKKALEKAILIDGQPAFAISDLLALDSSLRYDIRQNALSRQNKLIAQAFVKPSGFNTTMVIHKDIAFLPISLLPLIDIKTTSSNSSIQFIVQTISFDLRFSPLGRVSLQSSSLKAEFNRVQKLRTETLAAIRKSLSSNFVFLSDGFYGLAETRLSQNLVPYVFVTIVNATSQNSKSWRSCKWQSVSGFKLTQSVIGSNGFVLTATSTNALFNFNVQFANSNQCQVRQVEP
jgi:hypothetical protein